MIFVFMLVLVTVFPVAGRDESATPSAPSLIDRYTIVRVGDSTFRDARFMTMRKGDKMAYTMPAFDSLAEWQRFRDQLHQNILISTGLMPLPEKTPLNSRIFDRTSHADYTVEKVCFESYPGFFVTGNLYRPVGKTGPFPAILNPHGHWQNGRLENTELNSGPGRCINFARQGYVVFNYDMVGYVDSKQVPHTFASTPRHQLWGINLMGLQLWNSLRSLDFLNSLIDVDSTRIACTGESGGGTQTFMITAIDPRIKVSAPVNMVSAHFQGGCLCENAPGLRLDYFNVEIAAMTAPRPLLLVSTKQDWTKDNPTVEYPMVRSIYQWYGATDRVRCVQFDYPHNYNQDSREAVYAWFSQWLLGQPPVAAIKETAFTVDPAEQLRVFPGDQKPAGDMNEEKLTVLLQNQARETLRRAWPADAMGLETFKQTYGPIMKTVLAARPPQRTEHRIVKEWRERNDSLTQLMLTEAGMSRWIPALLFKPLAVSKEAAILVHPQGKAGLLNENSFEPNPLIKKLLRSGVQVLLIDPFNTGEHVWPQPVRDSNAKHFTTFNRTDCQERIQDILTAASFFNEVPSVRLYGFEQAGLWALLAAAAGEGFDQVYIDAAGGRLDEESYLLEYAFMPGLARYGAGRTAAALVAPERLTLFNAPENEFISAIRALYAACGCEKNLAVGKKGLISVPLHSRRLKNE